MWRGMTRASLLLAVVVRQTLQTHGRRNRADNGEGRMPSPFFFVSSTKEWQVKEDLTRVVLGSWVCNAEVAVSWAQEQPHSSN
jgi:hypothetical protein